MVVAVAVFDAVSQQKIKIFLHALPTLGSAIPSLSLLGIGYVFKF